MSNPPAMATTKMSIAKFAIISIIGMIVQYLIIFGGLAAALLAVGGTGAIGLAVLVGITMIPIYAILVIILFGISFFGFKKNPDNDLYRSLVVFFAPALLSILGIIATYFVLKGRQAL
ncbi:MAG: hypothetical protein KGI04_02805 [Candidatus Micrarchaeota archaeon]|nr:hypothetical protein [Candidatus Micrarchaeota archaeon]